MSTENTPKPSKTIAISHIPTVLDIRTIERLFPRPEAPLVARNLIQGWDSSMPAAVPNHENAAYRQALGDWNLRVNLLTAALATGNFSSRVLAKMEPAEATRIEAEMAASMTDAELFAVLDALREHGKDTEVRVTLAMEEARKN
jgi:hypothetical protein